MGLAEAAADDTHVWIDRWSLQSRRGRATRAKIDAEEFSFDLTLTETQAPCSTASPASAARDRRRNRPATTTACRTCRVAGSIVRQDQPDQVTGEAWLDHEWSSEYLDAEAAGWDWIGVNLDDGAALMAFRIRGARGEQRWAGGTLRDGDGQAASSAACRGRISRRAAMDVAANANILSGPVADPRGKPGVRPCSPCSTIRRTTRGSPPVRFIGRVRCEPMSSSDLSAVDIWK